MSGRTIFLFIFFLCFFASLFAQEAGNARDSFEETTGRGLIINTNPQGVRVYIDGVDRGLTPVTFNENIPDSDLRDYNITLVKEGFKERSFDITLTNNRRLVVSIEMEELRGQVLINVRKTEGSPDDLPFNPQIYTTRGENGLIDLSDDNSALLNLPAGYHTIRARAFGWEDASVTFYIDEDETSEIDIFMKPAELKIMNLSQSRKQFNPLNPNNLGVTEYRFEVTTFGTAYITINNRDGVTVFTKQIPLNTSVQQVQWNGKDDDGNLLPAGVYTVTAGASPTTLETVQSLLTLETEIDYSINIFPVTLLNGRSGLAFSPLPDVLPRGSYQIEAGVLYGKFILPRDFSEKINEEAGFSGFPFGIGLRVTPFENLETSAVLNINPRLNKTGFSVTGVVKYNILKSSTPLSFAAGVSYTFANENGEAPLGSGSGIGIFAPLSINLKMFTFVISPEIFWRGPEGIIPAVFISAGVLYRAGWFNSGVSMRVEFDFTENSGLPKFLAGAEGRFYPPPSNLFFSVQAGMWTKDSYTGGYGGIGIGLIF